MKPLYSPFSHLIFFPVPGGCVPQTITTIAGTPTVYGV